MRRPVYLLTIALAACAPAATDADRAELVGLWQPDDKSGRTVEFKADGVFDYIYDKGYTLRLDWKMDTKGKVTVTSANGVAKTCHYTVTGDKLAIDDGAGGTCVGPGVTPPSPMPNAFTRAS